MVSPVAKKTGRSPGPYDDKPGLDRILFFSDAVMAIAITLLVIDLRVPETVRGPGGAGLGPALLALWPNYLGYLLSFFIIGNYWLSHHRLFRPIRRYDDRLRWLNLLFLFFTALLPFSTRIIGLYPAARTAVIVYSLNVLPLSVVSYAMTRHAYLGHRLVEASFDAAEVRKNLDFARRGTVIFLACLVISMAFSFFPVWFLGFAGRSLGRRVWRIG